MTNFDIAKAILSDFPSSSNDGCWYSTSVHKDEVDAIRALADDSEMTKALKDLIVDLESEPNDSGCWYYDTFYAENVEKCRDLVKIKNKVFTQLVGHVIIDLSAKQLKQNKRRIKHERND